MAAEQAVQMQLPTGQTMRAARASAQLARGITWSGSKQSFLIAALLARPDRRDDCFRAYAYFRWVDDVVDEVAQSRQERLRFMGRQRQLADHLYRGERPIELVPEEMMLVDLVAGSGCRLQRYIDNFLAIIEFDADRRGRPITEAELGWYSETLGKAVTDAIECFIADDGGYPDTPARHLAATAAHVTHMLRDLVADLDEGYINVPLEYMAEHRFEVSDLACLPMRSWVMDRVELARRRFRVGKEYLDDLDDLRSKLAGYWYCARFEIVLDAIERDGYVLRREYNERRSWAAALKMAWIGLRVAARHLVKPNFRWSWDSFGG